VPFWGMAGQGWGAGGRSASSSAPGGNEQDSNAPVESPIPTQIETEVREEAQRLCDEFIQSGVEPEEAKLLTRLKVCAFVKSFEPDKPPRRLDHQNPYTGSGPFSAWSRPPGIGRGMAAGGGGGGMAPTRNGAISRPLTRAECKAVDNIMGDTWQSDISELFGGRGPGPGTANPGLSAFGGGRRVRGKMGSRAFAKGMRPQDMPNWGFGRGMGHLR
jgi:hypothetical protein